MLRKFWNRVKAWWHLDVMRRNPHDLGWAGPISTDRPFPKTCTWLSLGELHNVKSYDFWKKDPPVCSDKTFALNACESKQLSEEIRRRQAEARQGTISVTTDLATVRAQLTTTLDDV